MREIFRFKSEMNERASNRLEYPRDRSEDRIVRAATLR